MSVREIVLYWSRQSVHCHYVNHLIDANGLGIRKVCIDNRIIKAAVSSGSQFSVKNVPTITVLW